MNDRRLMRTLQQAGFRGSALKTAFGIAKRESGGRPDAFNPDRSTGDQSYGLFQINMLGSMGPARRRQFGLARNEDLFNPLVNARSAFRMSNGGRDFGAWGIGPNAYRSGAGYETIAKYVDQAPLPAGRVSKGVVPDFDVGQLLGGATKRDTFQLPDFDVGTFLSGGGDEKAFGDLGLTPPPTFAPPPTPVRAGAKAPGATRYTPPSIVVKGGITPPVSFRSTHVTSGLPSFKAIDIMGAPGTPVRAPIGGRVEYFHPTGAQGGGSMMFQADNGHRYWIGHVDRGVVGRVQAGQPIAVISGDHPRPHVHWAEE